MKVTPRQLMIDKLTNTLRSEAYEVLKDSKTPFIDRVYKLEVISSLKHYLSHFEEYQKVINDYDKHKGIDR